MAYICSVIFFIVSVSLIIASDLEEAEKKLVPCGIYGFRCLDKHRAQICDKKYEYGETTPAPRIFKCGKGLVCDEEKKEYCAPLETFFNNCTDSLKSNLRKKKQQKLRVRKKIQNYSSDDYDGSTITAGTTMNDDDENEQSDKSNFEPWKGNPPISCTSYGFYPGIKTYVFL